MLAAAVAVLVVAAVVAKTHQVAMVQQIPVEAVAVMAVAVPLATLAMAALVLFYYDSLLLRAAQLFQQG